MFWLLQNLRKGGSVAILPGGILGCGYYFWGFVGRVDFLLLLLLRVCKSSTSGSSDTTISTPRLIVVELRAIVLLWGRNVFGYYKTCEKGVALQFRGSVRRRYQRNQGYRD